MWGCFVHNIVNKRLKKPEFNCENIGDAYDCGCAEEEPKDKGKDEAEKPPA
jgi:FAD-linked sulfhydryl oxidase